MQANKEDQAFDLRMQLEGNVLAARHLMDGIEVVVDDQLQLMEEDPAMVNTPYFRREWALRHLLYAMEQALCDLEKTTEKVLQNNGFDAGEGAGSTTQD